MQAVTLVVNVNRCIRLSTKCELPNKPNLLRKLPTKSRIYINTTFVFPEATLILMKLAKNKENPIGQLQWLYLFSFCFMTVGENKFYAECPD